MATKESYERANRSPAIAASELHESLEVLQGRLDQQQWDEAIAELIRLILRVPEDLNLRLKLAQLYLKVENIDKAIEEFHLCAQAFYERGQYKDALGAATSILKLEPDSQFAVEMVRAIKEKLHSIRDELAQTLNEDLLGSLSTEALDDLALRLQLSVQPQGATIDREREPGFHFFIIRRGEAQLYLTTHKGEMLPIGLFQQGDFLSEISLLTGSPRTATVITTQPSEFWVMGKRDFEDFTAKYPWFKEVLNRYTREGISETLRLIPTNGLERRLFPRIPVDLEAQAVLLWAEGGSPSTERFAGIIRDLSLGGARLRIPLSHPGQWDQLSPRRQVRLSFALTPSVRMSLNCSIESVQPSKLGEAYAELGLSFSELSATQKEQIGGFIAGELAR